MSNVANRTSFHFVSHETGLECLHRSGTAHELLRGMNPLVFKEMGRIQWKHIFMIVV